jgi:hypothetical protein
MRLVRPYVVNFHILIFPSETTEPSATKLWWNGPWMAISSNSSHLEWRAGLSDTTLKGTHQGAIPSRFGLIWFSGFREDLNVIFYQNLPNLHNRYKSAE